MKINISNYTHNYITSFKHQPFTGLITMLAQIFFLIGWGIYFYFPIKDIFTIFIPGFLPGKGNIYAEMFGLISELTVYSYVFAKIFPLMFETDKKTKDRIIALLVSFVMLCLQIL